RFRHAALFSWRRPAHVLHCRPLPLGKRTMAISSIDPATGKTLQTFQETTDAEIEAKLVQSVEAVNANHKLSFAERADFMRKAAEILERDKQAYGKMMTEEMGKTLKSAVAEAEKCAVACRYYADHAAEFLKDEVVKTEASASYIRYLPIGPVLAVMPWNFPFWQVIRFAAPALMAGNAGVLKHASNVPGCALAIEAVFREAGFPENLFRTLLLSGREMKAIIEDPNIAAVTLTGSVPAGRQVAATAGGVLKKTVLELGGSDAYLVLDDADVEHAAEVAAV